MPTRTYRERRRLTCSRSCGISQGNTKRLARNTDVDDVAVWRLTRGDPVTSTKAERREATRLLTEHGQSTSWIAGLLHTTPRSVTRYRAELNPARKAVA